MTISSPLAPNVPFTRISKDHAKVRAWIGAMVLLPVVAFLVVTLILWSHLTWLLVLDVATIAIIAWIVAVRVRAVFYTGFHETDEELIVCRGILFREIEVVPYGRMQEVKVEDGPLMRAYGLATLTMETASTTTDAKIPGLPREEADRLRRRLTELGTTKMEGL